MQTTAFEMSTRLDPLLRSVWRGALPLALLASTPGCGTALRGAATEAPRAATPIVIDETLRMAEDPETRRRLAAVLASPEVKASVDELAAAFAAGAVGGLTTEQARERLEALASTVARVAGKGLESDIMPAIARAVRATLAAELGPEQQKVLTERLAGAATTVTRDVSKTIGAELPSALMKAMAQQLEKPEMRDHLALTTEHVAKSFILGSAEAIQKIQADTGVHTLERRLTRFIAGFVGLSILLGAVTVALGSWLYALHRRAKKYAADSERQRAVANRFLIVMASLRGKPYADDVYRVMQEQLQTGEGAEDLRVVLAKVGAVPRPKATRRKVRRRPSPASRDQHSRSDAEPERHSH